MSKQSQRAKRDARFWNWCARRYARQPVADEAAYQKKLGVTRELLRPDMEVFEFGCGTGSTALNHAPFVRHIIAIDISSKMIEIAERKAEAAGVSNVTFRCAALDDFTADDERFDVVMAHSILHLVDDRDAAIVRAYRLLRPGGFFVSSTICIGQTMRFLRFIAPVGRPFGLLPLLRFFTVDELVASIAAAGFTLESQWQPAKDKAVFIVAKKPDRG